MIEDKFDITLLNPGNKKPSVKKLMLEFISDKVKVEKYLNEVPCRIITNVSKVEATDIVKKFKRRGADIISMQCDFVTMRNSKLDDLFD